MTVVCPHSLALEVRPRSVAPLALMLAPTPEPIRQTTALLAPRPAPNPRSACPMVLASLSRYSGRLVPARSRRPSGTDSQP